MPEPPIELPIGFADDLRWLCDCLGLERPIVVGHSMGGNIALKLAVRSPEFVKAIVMIDTFVDGDSSFVQGLRELSDNGRADEDRAADDEHSGHA